MTKGTPVSLPLSLRVLALLAVLIAAAVLNFAYVPSHPPGMYIDESSIAYNAYTISQTGRDEYGNKWPLFFRAFGEYKNPTFIYLLAAIFRVTGPRIAVARLLSATLGLLTALLFGILAWRITKQVWASMFLVISATLTPWLYESSRLVFEVAIYPCLLLLFLLVLWRAARKDKWQASDWLALTGTLVLITYSYSIGRLLGPLLAAGLAFFITRPRWQAVVKTWLAYGLLLIPLLVFHRRHPGALTNRFQLLTYITPQSTLQENLREFVSRYLANVNPIRWLFTGESNIRDHLEGHGALLAVTVVLAIAGLILVLRNHRHEAWWRFILYGLVVSVIPASLTRSEFPQLRLIAFPVFFLALTIPAIFWLTDTRFSAVAGKTPRAGFSGKHALVVGAITVMVLQGAYFQVAFHRLAPNLWYVFDARFPRKVLSVALATGKKPIYLVDEPGKSGYIQAYWYGAVQGLDPGRLVRLPSAAMLPAGAVVISTAEDCENCRLLSRSINYIVYSIPPYEGQPVFTELPPDAFRAFIDAQNPPTTVRTGEKTSLNLIVKNFSKATWPALGEPDGRYAVMLRNRWLRNDDTEITNQDGKSRLPYDLEPGDTAGVSLEVTAPSIPGLYWLEVDLVQEQITRFSDRGSLPLRLKVTVNP